MNSGVNIGRMLLFLGYTGGSFDFDCKFKPPVIFSAFADWLKI